VLGDEILMALISKDDNMDLDFKLQFHKGSDFKVDCIGIKFTGVTDGEVYKMDGSVMKDSNNLDYDKMLDWMKNFKEGKLENYQRGQPLPKAPTEDGVHVLVGRNFKDVTEEKDALIEFYAPWCGHCKQLAPVYAELATEVKEVPDLVIAKMDATENDPPSQYKVEGYPTIYFKPKGGEPKLFEGARDLAGFKAYLEKNSEMYNSWKSGKATKKGEL